MPDVRGLLLDIDGVLTLSWRAIPGAAEALVRIREAGIPFALVTNTTTLSRERIAETLVGEGIAVEAREILTAAAATARYVRGHHAGRSVFLVARGDATREFDGVTLVGMGEERADVVVIGGITEDEGFTYDEVNAAFRFVMAGAPLVAMHRLAWWMTEAGPRLDTAAVLPAIEEAAGVRATVVGKPSAEFFAEALALVGVTPNAAAMVGDDLDADVAGSAAAGISSILVRTGKYREQELARASVRPDLVVDSIADVPALLERSSAD